MKEIISEDFEGTADVLGPCDQSESQRENISSIMLELGEHSLYSSVKSLPDLRIFMQNHVLAVWDFMTLLKSLQRELTCVSVPWVPSFESKKVARMVNEIVLGEESDLDLDGNPCDHFSLYLQAMREVDASTEEIENLVKYAQENPRLDDLSNYLNRFSAAQKNFLSHHLSLAFEGSSHRVAAAFFYGREKVIPLMFESIVKLLKQNQVHCPRLIYYLERHIELDGDEHSVLAGECLEILCGDDQQKWGEAMSTAQHSLELRRELWDHTESMILNSSS